MKTLAIVGSITFADRFAWTRAERIICEELDRYQPELCASGGAKGIDSMFHAVAQRYGFNPVELFPHLWEDYLPRKRDFLEFLPRDDILNFPPGKPRWEAPNGYRDRNVRVATAANRLVAIRCHQSPTFGSGWTLQFAQQLERETRMEIL